MTLKDELETWCADVFGSRWEARSGINVPDADSRLGLMNEAIELEGTVLYADMADSTKMVDAKTAPRAAEIYKTFLHCAARVIRSMGGTITAYDGDRIMAVFVGDSKNTDAAKAALQLRWAVANIVMPQMQRVYQNDTYVLNHVTGIDTSALFVAKTGVRGANDLVWVGRAANHAAKLSTLPASYSYITDTVFQRLANSSKYSSDGILMWEAVRWNTFNDALIYRSNWWWAFN